LLPGLAGAVGGLVTEQYGHAVRFDRYQYGLAVKEDLVQAEHGGQRPGVPIQDAQGHSGEQAGGQNPATAGGARGGRCPARVSGA